MSMSNSPDENLLADANEAHTELERRLDTIITAWESDPDLRIDVLRRWPALGEAIQMVCVMDSLDKANDETTIVTTTDVRDWLGRAVQATITSTPVSYRGSTITADLICYCTHIDGRAYQDPTHPCAHHFPTAGS